MKRDTSSGQDGLSTRTAMRQVGLVSCNNATLYATPFMNILLNNFENSIVRIKKIPEKKSLPPTPGAAPTPPHNHKRVGGRRFLNLFIKSPSPPPTVLQKSDFLMTFF